MTPAGITQRLNPRVCRVAALPAPNDRERTQWYFQRRRRPGSIASITCSARCLMKRSSCR
ncbi:hypothetical protein [Pseudomonas sp. ACN5]|uniref:hypothetical protein n=1 Tax=unclassified Pseudomonas TaxID=196821 RepID=UPI003531F8E2